jgi:hypothetical protein
MDLNQVRLDILRSGVKDLIGLWETEKVVESYEPGLSVEERRKVALEQIAYLLERGLMVAGERTAHGFVPSKAELHETVTLIESKWRALEGELTPVDEAWFKLTEAGRQALSLEAT